MYLDPGFGSMLIQALIAGFAAVVVLFGIYRQKVRAFFSRNKKKSDKDDIGEESIDASEPAVGVAEERDEGRDTGEDSTDGK